MNYCPLIFEEWKRIHNYIPEIKDQYLISNFGNIYSEITCRSMAYAISNGYLTVQLSLISGLRKTFYLHRLVGICFLYDQFNNIQSLEINHKNMNRSECGIWNIEWMTKQENIHHEMMNRNTQSYIQQAKSKWSKTSYGDKNGMSKISELDARKLCERFELGDSIKDAVINAGFEMTHTMMNIAKSIYYRKRWCHISNEYKF